jgi:hypothetical protein
MIWDSVEVDVRELRREMAKVLEELSEEGDR